MEENKDLKSIWGKWWIPIRKWFYSAWLICELSIRFYDYSQSIYLYFIRQLDVWGEIITQTLAVISSIVIFSFCTFYLTIPACIILYKFFKDEALTKTRFEQNLKYYF